MNLIIEWIMRVKVMILLMMRLALMVMVGYDDGDDEHNGDEHNVKMVMNKFVMLFKVN